VFDLLILHEDLIMMLLRNSAVLGPSIGQDPEYCHSAIVEQICRRDWDLGRVEFGKSHARVRIQGSLLMDSADAFEIANVIGVLS
jgi:hypothetical protein